jgi:CheY-like chemotaxis protein
VTWQQVQLHHINRSSSEEAPGWLPSGLPCRSRFAVPLQLRAASSQPPPHVESQVRQAMDGEEALSFLQDEPCLPDIVLLDVRMPGMSGYDVCKSLRRMFPDCFIPVIMVSAQTSEEEIVEGLLSGSNDYVTKPFGRQALLARIKSHLQVKHWVYHTPKDAAPQQLADAGEPVALCMFEVLPAEQRYLENSSTVKALILRRICQPQCSGIKYYISS